MVLTTSPSTSMVVRWSGGVSSPLIHILIHKKTNGGYCTTDYTLINSLLLVRYVVNYFSAVGFATSRSH